MSKTITAPQVTGRTLKYASAFECAGSACISTCCSGWRIGLTPSDEMRLKAAIKDPAEVHRLISRDSLGAKMQMGGENGGCVALTPELLCGVQAKHGHQALPATCATYPRLYVRDGMEITMTGVLSCPEMARLLYDNEDAADVVSMDPNLAPNASVAELPIGVRVPNLRVLKSGIAAILTAPEYPISTNLFTMAWLARHLDDSDWLDPEKALIEATNTRPDLHAWLQNGFGLNQGSLGLNFVKTLLYGRLEHAYPPEFQMLMRKAIQNYHPNRQQNWDPMNPSHLPLEHMARVYTARRDLWLRLDPAGVRFVSNAWLASEWLGRPLLGSSTLVRHTQRLLSRWILFRFMLFSHPGLDTGASLQAVATDTTWKLARTYDHANNFLARVEDLLDTETFDRLEAMAALIRM